MANERVAIITAGGSGMGAGAARALVAKGHHVAILSSSGKGEALAKELGGIGVTGSNQSNDDLKRLVDAAMDKWGRVEPETMASGHAQRRRQAEAFTILSRPNLDEHAFRYNRRKTRGVGRLVARCLENMLARAPMTMRQLIDDTSECRLFAEVSY